MPTKRRRTKKPTPSLLPLHVHFFQESGRIPIPGSAYGGPEQQVTVAVLMCREGNWIPYPLGWWATRHPDSGDLRIDLCFDIARGCVLLYPALPKPVRKQRAKKKGMANA